MDPIRRLVVLLLAGFAYPARLVVLLLAGFAYPARAACPTNQRLVYEPTSGKSGFRMELVINTTDGIGRALVYRPFSQAPDDYKLITEQTSDSSARYVIIGQAGILRLETTTDGQAVLEANRDMPSRWRLAPC
jgi:hypothetical protein